MTIGKHMITGNFRLERSHVHPFTHSSLTSESRLACSSLCPLAFVNLQEQRLCSISEQPVSPCGKNNFLISTVKLSSFNLCLLFHILLPCSTVICLAGSTSWHVHSLGGLLSYSMMLCLLQALQVQVPPVSPDWKIPLPLPTWRPGSFPQSCSLNRQSLACETERHSCIPSVTADFQNVLFNPPSGLSTCWGGRHG